MLPAYIVPFSDMLEPFYGFNVNLNQISPHGKWANPSSALTVEGFVDDHILKCFAVLRKADDLILVTFVRS